MKKLIKMITARDIRKTEISIFKLKSRKTPRLDSILIRADLEEILNTDSEFLDILNYGG